MNWLLRIIGWGLVITAALRMAMLLIWDPAEFVAALPYSIPWLLLGVLMLWAERLRRV